MKSRGSGSLRAGKVTLTTPLIGGAFYRTAILDELGDGSLIGSW